MCRQYWSSYKCVQYNVTTVRESALILLQTVPTHIQVRTLQDRLVSAVSGDENLTDVRDCLVTDAEKLIVIGC